jgi:hypothetical protein
MPNPVQRLVPHAAPSLRYLPTIDCKARVIHLLMLCLPFSVILPWYVAHSTSYHVTKKPVQTFWTFPTHLQEILPQFSKPLPLFLARLLFLAIFFCSTSHYSPRKSEKSAAHITALENSITSLAIDISHRNSRISYLFNVWRIEHRSAVVRAQNSSRCYHPKDEECNFGPFILVLWALTFSE